MCAYLPSQSSPKETGVIRETVEPTGEHAAPISPPRWEWGLQRIVPLYYGDITALIGRHAQELLFDRQRARFIVSRTRVMAALFAVLTPLWIPLDILAFPRHIWVQLGLARIVSGLLFWTLTIYCRRAISLNQAYLALSALFVIPAAFFLFSDPLFWAVPLTHAGAIMARGYAFLIFLLGAGIGIFPLTLIELFTLSLFLLAVGAVPALAHHRHLIPFLDAVTALWLLVLVLGVGALASLSQLNLLSKLFHKAVLDPLTGALNRESGIEMIAAQLALAQRHQYPLSVVFIDLDDFKTINDTQGHEAGDRILAAIADSWRYTLRQSDALVRWGGDEFIALLPYATRPQAQALIDRRLRERVDDARLPPCSIGISEWPKDHADTWQTLVALADQRMYQTKVGGANSDLG